jgi:hypothetical protein
MFQRNLSALDSEASDYSFWVVQLGRNPTGEGCTLHWLYILQAKQPRKLLLFLPAIMYI